MGESTTPQSPESITRPQNGYRTIFCEQATSSCPAGETWAAARGSQPMTCRPSAAQAPYASIQVNVGHCATGT